MKAKDFAIKAHGDQKYGVEQPYSAHLQYVVDVLVRFKVRSQTVLEAAWLHDVLEDTSVTEAELAREFASATVSLVKSSYR
jgi:GTP pyrophosphokinase